MRELTALYADLAVWLVARWEALAPFVAFIGIGAVLGVVTLLIRYLRIPDIQFYIRRQARLRERFGRRRQMRARISRMPV
ncbi:MAG: hypothetical protein A4S14_12840 [Proteobacteria bacterium SG_bin9]|nr:MAG: hypothetical protein A4S14_12840 [Proteobacteria bacterium SG_bin9]